MQLQLTFWVHKLPDVPEASCVQVAQAGGAGAVHGTRRANFSAGRSVEDPPGNLVQRLTLLQQDPVAG